MLRNLDILVLLAALPVFVLVDAPLIGYAVVAAAWIAGRIGTELAARRRREALAEGNRNAALGVTGAILALALVTVSLIGQFAEHVLHPEAEGSLR